MRFFAFAVAALVLAAPAASAHHDLFFQPDCLNGGGGLVGDLITLAGDLECMTYDFAMGVWHTGSCFLLGGC